MINLSCVIYHIANFTSNSPLSIYLSIYECVSGLYVFACVNVSYTSILARDFKAPYNYDWLATFLIFPSNDWALQIKLLCLLSCRGVEHFFFQIFLIYILLLGKVCTPTYSPSYGLNSIPCSSFVRMMALALNNLQRLILNIENKPIICINLFILPYHPCFIWYPPNTMRKADYADYLMTSLLHSQEEAAGIISLCMNANKTVFMHFK